jgi:hypothetical protein
MLKFLFINGSEDRDGVINLKPHKDKLVVIDSNGEIVYVAATGAEARKQNELLNIVSPTKKFYGDAESRGDLCVLLLLRLANTIPDDEILPTAWKTSLGVIDGLTFGDVKLALTESLTKKGALVGVV